MALSGEAPLIEDCVFETNTAGVEGGSIHVAGCTGQGDCEDDDVCTYADCVDSGCTYEARTYGDVNGDGMVDVFDIICVLDGFAGVYTVCPHDNLDISPCVPDTDEENQVVDIFDVLAVLSAFSGVFECDCPPQPKIQRPVTGGGNSPGRRAAKIIASEMEVALVPRYTNVARGGATVLDAYADHVENFRGYQLRMSAEGGLPIAAFVDTQRSDFVFAGREYRHKSDPRVHRIVAALLSGEVTTAARVYLGTFVVRADQVGVQTLRIGVHPDDGMILVDPQGRVHNAQAPDGAEVTVR